MGVFKLICHQKEERSFKIGAFVFPICSRCTGIYVGLIIGFFLSGFMFEIFIVNRLFPFLIYFLCTLPLAIDGILQSIGFWQSDNIRRFFTGFLAGMGMGAIIPL